jgi:hypothetical protein
MGEVTLAICRFFLALALVGGSSARPKPSKSGEWSKEPASFRGVKWESTESEARYDFDALRCSDGGAPKARLCGAVDSQLGGVSVLQQFYFVDDRLQYVSLHFDGKQFSRMKAYFVEHYGSPTETVTHSYDGGEAGTLTNETLMWRGRKIVITMDKFKGEAWFLTRAYFGNERRIQM